MSTQTQSFESTQKPGKSTSQVFWLRVMNDIIRPRFLKVKQKQENQCLLLDTFDKFYQCHQYQSKRLQQDTIEMEFFAKKFDTCVQQGVKALYPLKRVQDICSNKIINIIKEQTSLRRKKQKESMANVVNVQPAIQANSIQGEAKPQEKKPSNSIQSQIIKLQDGKYINGHRLTWQQQKSLEKVVL